MSFYEIFKKDELNDELNENERNKRSRIYDCPSRG
jgi:hypothetical protein